jgi:hypothetical protein
MVVVSFGGQRFERQFALNNIDASLRYVARLRTLT